MGEDTAKGGSGGVKSNFEGRVDVQKEEEEEEERGGKKKRRRKEETPRVSRVLMQLAGSWYFFNPWNTLVNVWTTRDKRDIGVKSD